MSSAREKRLLLGLIALIAPIPLPFNGVLTWPFWTAYSIAVVAFLVRARLDPDGWLPTWAMNLLAIAYLPYFALDLRMLSQGRLVSAVTHLLLFTVLVKLFALRRERDKWQAAIAVFFLFLTSMATSVHPAIVIYLVAFLAAGLLLFTRFAQLHLISTFGADAEERRLLMAAPVGPFLVFAAIATLVFSVPLFAFMPRVKNPLVTGRGQGFANLGSATGFSEDVTLDTIGTIRASREVAMRVRYPDGMPDGHEMRFKGGSYDVYRGGAWRPAARSRLDLRSGTFGSTIRLAPVPPSSWVEVFLRPVTGSAVLVPVEAVVVEEDQQGIALWLDRAGVVRRYGGTDAPIEYRVGMAPTEAPLADLFGTLGGASGAGAPGELSPEAAGGATLDAAAVEAEVSPDTLDLGAVSPRVAELARRVAGGGSPAERARRIERHLITEYGYSLELLGRPLGADPIEAFLFDHGRGHCEYFASSMVLMLRAADVPSRLATGFLGGEFSRLEDYWVVRQSNAHAWVEAYLPGSGWTVFDPTPPGGRPESGVRGLGSLFAEGWDYLVFRWDRYVLTYGFQDQMHFLTVAYGMWRDLFAVFGGGDEEAATGAPGADAAAATAEPPGFADPRAWGGWSTLLALLAIVALLVALGLFRRSRRPVSSAEAYRRLRRGARRAGLPVAEADPPYGFARSLGRKFPAARSAGGEVVSLYVRESYGGQRLAGAEGGRLEEALTEALRALSKAGRPGRTPAGSVAGPDGPTGGQ